MLRSNDPPAGSAGAAVSGESDAEVYARLAPEMIRFAVSIVGPSDAEDLVGAAVLKAISAPRWSRIANKRAYLYRVMLNEARSWHRGRRRRLEREHRVLGRDDGEPEKSDPSVLAAVRSLTIRQRAVIHLVTGPTFLPRTSPTCWTRHCAPSNENSTPPRLDSRTCCHEPCTA